MNKDNFNTCSVPATEYTECSIHSNNCDEMSLSYMFAHGLGYISRCCSAHITKFPSEIFKKENLNYILSEINCKPRQILR